MRVQPVIDELKNVPGLRDIQGSEALPDVFGKVKRVPAAFVVPSIERAGPNNLSTGFDQRVVQAFSVVIIIKRSGRQESAAREKLHDLQTDIINKIAAWLHPDMEQPTEYAGGRLLQLPDGYLVWQIDFTTAYRLRK